MALFILTATNMQHIDELSKRDYKNTYLYEEKKIAINHMCWTHGICAIIHLIFDSDLVPLIGKKLCNRKEETVFPSLSLFSQICIY